MTLRPWVLVLVTLIAWGCATETRQRGVDREADEAARVHTQLGVSYLEQGRNELALENLKKAIDHDAGYAEAQHAIAFLYERVDRDELAERHYRRAVRLDPDNSRAHNDLGRFYCERGRYDDAERQFLKALDNPVYETPEVSYFNAGTCARRAGDTEAAEDYFRQALDHNPRFGRALWQMARLQHEQGEHLNARAYLQRYEAVGERSPEFLWLGVEVEQALGDREAAAEYAQSLKEEFPDAEQTQRLRESEAP